MIIEQKKKLRTEMLDIRSSLNSKKKAVYDNWICEELKTYIQKNNVQSVHVYLPMSAEINILPLISWLLAENITVIAPKTLKRPNLMNLQLFALNQLEKGVFGTVHPNHSDEYQGDYDLIIVPGLAFDSAKNRLGYGGAYYDTFLKGQQQTKKIGISYPFQIINEVPLEAHDIQLDQLLYNTNIELQ